MSCVQPPSLRRIQSKVLGLRHPEALFVNLLRGSSTKVMLCEFDDLEEPTGFDYREVGFARLMFSNTSGHAIRCYSWVPTRVAARVCTWKFALRGHHWLHGAVVDDGATCARLRWVDLGLLDVRIKFHSTCHGGWWYCVEALCSPEISISTPIDPVRLR